jgi:hypothetical protein
MKLSVLYERQSTWKSKAAAAALGGALGLGGAKLAYDKFTTPPKREFPAETSPDPRILEKPDSRPASRPASQPTSRPEPPSKLAEHFGKELPIIKKAAERNNCRGYLFYILLAIREAEDGKPGREFGVLHPKAKDTDLNTQAGWAAATIVKNYKRWQDAGKPSDFITFLGNRYAPPNVKNDPKALNRHWIKNVKYWVNKLKP